MTEIASPDSPKTVSSDTVRDLRFCLANVERVPRESEGMMDFLLAVSEIQASACQLLEAVPGPGTAVTVPDGSVSADDTYAVLRAYLAAAIANTELLPVRDFNKSSLDALGQVRASCRELRAGVEAFPA